jgi:tRNA (cytidine56-2'-O)-methyltransferase
MTTHCALIARALGAREMLYSGERDSGIEDSVKKVVKNWGGSFKIHYEKNWRRIISGWKGTKVHLSIYGLPIQKQIARVRKQGNILLIVGGEKVPGEVYQLCDFNIAVSPQPHSELGALSVFLHEFFRGRELDKRFPGAKIRVIPQERGKKTVKR